MSNFEALFGGDATLFGDQNDANAFVAAFAPDDVLPAVGSVPLASPVPANHPVPAADDGILADALLAAGLEDPDLVFPARPTPLAASPVPAADDGILAGNFFAAGPEEDPALVFPANPAPLAASPIPAAVPAAAAFASVPVAAVDNSSFPADGSFYPADVANPAMSDNEFNVDMGNFNDDVGGNNGDNFFEFGMEEAVDGNNNNDNNNDGWAFLYDSHGSVNVQMPNNDLDDLLNDALAADTPAPGSNQADNLDPRLQAGEGYAQGGMEAPQPVVPAVPSPVMPQPEPVAAPVQQGVPHPQAVQPQMPPPPFPPPSQFPAPLPTPTPTLLQQQQQHQQQQYQQQQYQQQQYQQQQVQQQHYQQQQQQQGQQEQQQQQHQEHQPWKFAQRVGPKTFPLKLRAEPNFNASLVEQLRQHNPEAFANVPLRQGQAGQPSQPLPGPQAPAAPAAAAAAAAAPDADAPPAKRGRGRPKGSKNKNPRPKEPLHRVRGGAGSRVAKARPRSAADGEQILAAAAAAAAANEEEQRPVEGMEGVQHQHQPLRLTHKERFALGLRQKAEGEAEMIMSQRAGPRPRPEELMTKEEWMVWSREQEEEKKWLMQEILDTWFQRNRREYLENLEDDGLWLLSPQTLLTTPRADQYRLPLRDDDPDEDMDVDVPPGGAGHVQGQPGGNAQPGGHHGHVDIEATIQEIEEHGQLRPAQIQILARALNRGR
ncbi:uncharacterized protein B0T23DRAFT_416332 [Neurospora hispaniola]|uniref:Uncharacterized protein n=1 Tax=Neurospora hispaniola TaxID=588809 RepID=A0AAJ0HY13_9PEZI|nr:hypothetical protein B0T23DRAFT_416332 [Neurospora hispaniola]